MADSELKRSSDEDMQMTQDLEGMIEDMENMSVQLTWMVHDMVVLRTSPEHQKSMQSLEEAYLSCRAVICGGNDQEMQQEAQN
ncbi:synaptonemal complex central element protein 3 [Lampris incognitus]|uniref:synaptonemal complex central element protein 3 n=1 Tax=Lampris incognitus TaxID=2546036 RepID=UPI0024B54605|nr:synaptonemal complex central element protein 3 [Lampris incognitus]